MAVENGLASGKSGVDAYVYEGYIHAGKHERMAWCYRVAVVNDEGEIVFMLDSPPYPFGYRTRTINKV